MALEAKSAQPPCAMVTFGKIATRQSIISADHILSQLLSQKCWFTTKLTRSIGPGTKLLFYQNGAGFRASAVVSDVVHERQWTILQEAISFAFNYRLMLTDIEMFERPIALGALVNELTFISNKLYWGTALRSSPRSIPLDDYLTIMKLAHGE